MITASFQIMHLMVSVNWRDFTARWATELANHDFKLHYIDVYYECFNYRTTFHSAELMFLHLIVKGELNFCCVICMITLPCADSSCNHIIKERNQYWTIIKYVP